MSNWRTTTVVPAEGDFPMTATEPPPTGLALWWLVPVPVRLQLQAGPPLDSRLTGDSYGVAVAVGSQWPLKLLVLTAAEAGVRCELWQLCGKSPRLKSIADETVEPRLLTLLLQRWVKSYLQ